MGIVGTTVPFGVAVPDDAHEPPDAVTVALTYGVAVVSYDVHDPRTNVPPVQLGLVETVTVAAQLTPEGDAQLH